MTKEFKSLSEKRKLECISTDGIHYYNYPEEDIKEFIKRLKKEWDSPPFHDVIDKLAGDKLITKS